MFQLILNPIRDWNSFIFDERAKLTKFQLILNPIRDWNNLGNFESVNVSSSN